MSLQYYHLPMPDGCFCNLIRIHTMTPKVGIPTSIIVNYESVFNSKEFKDKFIKFYADPFSTSDSQLFKDIRKELDIITLLTKHGIDISTLSDEQFKRVDDNNYVILNNLVKEITECSIIQELCENKSSNGIGVSS